MPVCLLCPRFHKLRAGHPFRADLVRLVVRDRVGAGLDAGQDSVAVPELLPEVLDDGPDPVGWPGAPGTVQPLPPLLGICMSGWTGPPGQPGFCAVGTSM